MPTLTLTLSVDLPSNLFLSKESQNATPKNSKPIDTSAKILEYYWDQATTNTEQTSPNLSNCSIYLNFPNLENSNSSNSSINNITPKFGGGGGGGPKPLPTIPTQQPSNGLQLIQGSQFSPSSTPLTPSQTQNSKYITSIHGRHSIGRTSLPPKNRSSKIQKVSLSEILDDIDSSGISMSRKTTSSSTTSLTRLTPQGPRPLLDDSPPLSYPLELHKSAPSSLPSNTTHRRSSSLAANFGKSTSTNLNTSNSGGKKGFISSVNNLLKKSSFSGLSNDQGGLLITSSTKIGDLSRLQSKSECPSLSNSVEDLIIEDEVKPRRKSLDLGETGKITGGPHEPIIRPRNESLNTQQNQRPLTVYWSEAPAGRFHSSSKSPQNSPKQIANRSVSLAKKRNNNNTSNGSTGNGGTGSNSKPGSIFTRNKSHKSVSSIFGSLEERPPSTGLEFLWEEVSFDKQLGSVRWSKLDHLPWFKLNLGKGNNNGGIEEDEDEGLVINDSKGATSPSKNTDMRYLVSLELLTTESSYLSNLQYMISAYHKPLVDASPSPVSPDDLNNIFFTITQLLKLSQTLEFILGTVIDESLWNTRTSCIGPIFLDLKDDWNLILKYCKNYQYCNNLVKNLISNNQKFKSVLEEGNLKNPNKQSFLELMILPVQRLTRYSLLLNAIKKHTSPSHPDFPYLLEAIQLLDNLGMEANLSNNLNPTSQNSKATQELHLSIKNCPQNLIIPQNSKLIQTEAHDLILDRRVKMFIFDNILIIAIARKKWQLMKTGDRWKYLTTLQINNLYLIKVTDNTGKLVDPPVILAISQPKSPASVNSLVSDADSFIKTNGAGNGGGSSSSNNSDHNFNLDLTTSSISGSGNGGSVGGGEGQYLALQFNTGKVFREWLNFIAPKLTTYSY